MVTETTISDDKVRERILLLRRFLPYLEWGHPNEVREKAYNVLCESREVSENAELSLICANLRLNKPLRIDELARIVSDSQIEKLVSVSPLRDYYTFRVSTIP